MKDFSNIKLFGRIRYNDPIFQVFLVGMVCFCCPGMYNVINGMGAGGQMDDSTAKDGNVALYAAFAVFGFFGGAMYNFLGVRLTLCIGGLCYALYSGSLLNYNHTHNKAFVIGASAVLGLGAACLWTAQGVIMMSYPSEGQKGKAVGLFFIVFNLGGVLGGFIPFGMNFNSNAGAVSDGTYAAFLGIMIVGAAISWLLLPPSKVVRDDGSKVPVKKFDTNIMKEVIGTFKVFTHKQILLITPFLFCVTFYYSYEFGAINGVLFSVRSRSWNNVFYWAFEMLGAYALGRFLDTPRYDRKTKGLYALTAVSTICMAVWGGCLALQLQYTREDHPRDLDFIDTPGAFWPKWLLYVLFGLCDALCQTLVFWILGSLSNDSTVLAQYAGYAKAIQSIGGAISWRIDAIGTAFLTQMILNWALFAFSIPFTYILVGGIKDTNNTEESEDKIEAAA
ncbi:MFS general substrate transporter [Basidiobolus meristosporus CBS 931.73]|uniref:MFS general substrate transporter n=1 Tax=Basidiobolus meristosporus CBS 931.73 TaxID=1314790 RepID=A0A1Y1YUK5_9FUNG|nr:MFS general substrate transporter [Basidiobolus meristosporus CBS 931.73]|eukprot:ORY01245.1 MFS general substrate transporter [Basidiobolus meristosporus CBS 931.73]